MFSKFSLENLPAHQFSDQYQIGKEMFDTLEKSIHSRLEEFVGKDGTIDGTKLQDAWFPSTEHFDIFLSHSHKDLDLAIALSGWLYDAFHLKTFIDACLWGYSNDLLRNIDNKYCLFEDGSMYSYFKRNYSTSHVHMMLSIALSKVIDNTECVMFLNTPNSISWREDLSSIDGDSATISPWIYHELAMTSLIRRKELEEYRRGKWVAMSESYRAFDSVQPELNIEYDISDYVKELIPLDLKDLLIWELNYLDKDQLRHDLSMSYALDQLYINKQIISIG